MGGGRKEQIMIIVQSVGKNIILARDENAQWYEVLDNSVTVGQSIDLHVCSKLNKKLCGIYENAIKLIEFCKANPEFS